MVHFLYLYGYYSSYTIPIIFNFNNNSIQIKPIISTKLKIQIEPT